MIPSFIIHTWFFGLLSLGLLGGAVFAGREWNDRSWGWDPDKQQSVFAPHIGWNEDTAILGCAVALLFVAVFGGSVVKLVLRLSRGTFRGMPVAAPKPNCVERIRRPDGSELHIECYGPEDGIPIILTHGWTLDGSEWKYLLRTIEGPLRFLVWDQPGLGKSTRPSNRDYSMEKLAADLRAVLTLANDRPAVLIGHSIGGMIMLTFARLFGEDLGIRVMGMVLTHTTPTDPVRTTSGAAFYRAIEKPILVPMMYLTIALSPLFWLLNWLSYRNGSAHLSVMRGSFAGTETWEQIEFFARFQIKASPAVVARGMLGMMRYDASNILKMISVPTLVVAADRDTTTKPEASDWIETAITTSQRITLSPAKHLGLIEHHEKYAKAVVTFAHQCRSLFNARD